MSSPNAPAVDQPHGPLTGELRAKALAQAVRFLSSLRTRPRGRAPEAIAEQRVFLQSKGLDGALIAQAEIDATPPASIASVTQPSSSATASEVPSQEALDADADAFAQARAAFDDPLAPAPSVPARTYPRNVLDLYRAPQTSSNRALHAASPLIPPRSVLMAFFLKLSGSALYAAVVGVLAGLLWRAAALPRMVATRDARAVVLAHARELVQRLTTHSNALRRSTAALVGYPVGADIALESDWPHERGVDEEGRQTSRPLKPALKPKQKKVSFTEDTKSSPEPGSIEGAEEASLVSGEGEDAPLSEESDPPPPDLTASLRDALADLSAALRRDRALDEQSTLTAPAGEEEAPNVALWSSDEGSDDSPSADEEELEFDPYKPTKEEKAARRAKKAGQGQAVATSGAASSSDWVRGQAAADFRLSLNRLGRSFETQRFRSSTYAAPAPGEPSELSSTVPLIKSEIRSFKGLLLRRRNFPAFRTTGVSTP